MKIRPAGLCLGLLLLSSLPLSAQSAPLVFPLQGFSIAPLEGTAAAGNVQPLIMMLPTSQGFAPNVNVQIQAFDGTMIDYANLSLGQFKAMKMKVLDKALTEKSVFFEYTGPYAAGHMHWYARGFLGEGKVYLVTATCLESQWNQDGDALRTCVDSFTTEAGK